MSEVILVKGADIKEITKEAIRRTGFQVAKDARVLIKPNIVTAKPANTGVTTHPEIICGVVEFLLDRGVKDICIGESAWTGCDTETAFRVCGIYQIGQCYGVDVANFEKENDTVEVNISGTKEKIRLHRKAAEADVLINLPVLKTHPYTVLTLGMKNLKGCLPDSEKRRFHRKNLDEYIVYLNKVLKSDLCVMDAILGLTGGSAMWGETLNLGLVLAGRDVVAVDSVACSLVGIAPEEIDHIRMAGEEGLGVNDLNGITTIGVKPRQFYQIKPTKLSDYSNVKDAGACSPCATSLKLALDRFKKEGKAFKGAIYVGPHKDVGDGLLIGDCLKRHGGNHIAGCPPTAMEIYEYLNLRIYRIFSG